MLPQLTWNTIPDLQALCSLAPSYNRDRNYGAHGLGLGHFLSGPGFYFHTIPDTASHVVKSKFFFSTSSLHLCSFS